MRWRAVGVALLGIANALVLVWGSGAWGVSSTSASRQLAAVLAGACIGGTALLWVALERRFERMPRWWVLGLALLVRLIAVQASPLLEDDHFRYLWDGLRTATALDPYRLPPSAFFGATDLPPRWQDILSGINNPDIPSIYGPLLQWLFALAHAIAPRRTGAVQGLLLVVDMAVLGLLARQGVGSRALLVYALHPLILKEAMASAHPDGVVALCLLLALAAWQQRRAAWVGVMLGLAVCTKVAALVALPMLLLSAALPFPAGTRWAVRWAISVAAAFAVTVGALYLPFVLAGDTDAAALKLFASHWHFNPLLYRVLELALPAQTARPAAALLVVAGVAWLARPLLVSRRGASRGQPLPALDGAFAVLLLLSPVVNPWYWLWVLALSLRLNRSWLAVASMASTLAYLNSTVLADASTLFGSTSAAPSTPYAVPWPLAVVQVLVLLMAWHGARACRARRARRARDEALPTSARAWQVDTSGLARPADAL